MALSLGSLELAKTLVEQNLVDRQVVQELLQKAVQENRSFVTLLAQSGRISQPEIAALCNQLRDRFADQQSTREFNQVTQDAPQSPVDHFKPESLNSTGSNESLPIDIRRGPTPDSVRAALGASGRTPTSIGPYAITGILGKGGMGIVYRARHQTLGREVALKVLISGQDASPVALSRFLSEAKTVAALGEHPGIVNVLDVGQEEQRYYMSMELVEGTDFKTLIRAKKVTPRAGARVVADMADALSFAHSKNIIHRDIKPANILIDRHTHQSKLGDFGIAKTADGGGENGAGVTMTGAVLGTLPYMAPEQAIDSKEVDTRSDVYGLGAVLYEVLTGRPPHIGRSPTNILVSLLHTEPPKPRSLNPDIEPSLEAICLKAIDKDPDTRFQSAAELRDALKEFRIGAEEELGTLLGEFDPKQKRTQRILIGIIALLLVSTLTLTFLVLKSRTEPEPLPQIAKLTLLKPDPSRAYGPQSNFFIKPSALKIAGKVLPLDSWVLLENNRTKQRLVVRANDGEFEFSNVFMQEGTEHFTLYCSLHGKLQSKQLLKLKDIQFTIDTSGPKIDLPESYSDFSSRPQTELLVRCLDKDFRSLEISPSQPRIGDTNSFRYTLALSPGMNTFTLKALDFTGNQTKRIISIGYAPKQPETGEIPSAKGPKLQFDAIDSVNLYDGEYWSQRKEFPVSGRATPADIQLTVNQIKIPVEDGQFNRSIPIQSKRNELVFRGEANGKKTQRTFIVNLDQDPPKLKIQGLKKNTNPSAVPRHDYFTESSTIRVELKFSEPVTNLKIAVKGPKQDDFGPLLSYKQLITDPYQLEPFTLKNDGPYQVRINAKDRADNSFSKTLTILHQNKVELKIHVNPLVKFKKKNLVISGRVNPRLGTKLKNEGKLIGLKNDGAFALQIPISKLKGGSVLIATRADGETAQHSIRFKPELLENCESWQKATRTKQGQVDKYVLLGHIAKTLSNNYTFNGFETFQCNELRFELATFTHKSTGLILHLIPGGSLARSNRGGKRIGGRSRRKPMVDKLTVNPFLIGKFELRKRIWDEVLDRKEIDLIPDNQTIESEGPIRGMTHPKALKWLQIAQKKSKSTRVAPLRLPTSIEWSYACQAQASTIYFWGDEPTKNGKWVWEEAPARNVNGHADLKEWNAFGLVDMPGSLCEWTSTMSDDKFGKDEKVLVAGGLPEDGPEMPRHYEAWFRRPVSQQPNKKDKDPMLRRKVLYNKIGMRVSASLPQNWNQP
jgi:hypothetical protein